MSSLIPDYNYDIFISYRQKDNKGDKWVSEFVEALKTELESTFKEEISVYFDINPHDGLLETHDVDASLKEKLKCLVFIPIISRTYCDPKSFAWGHEFKAFVEQASKDPFGLKVKLKGGNIANRILPVQIHDLNTEDRKLVESELGGYLRGIEFIYKEPGVNRPLRANEDHPDNNLNNTFYRNQINKVANAVSEIIDGLKNPDNSGKGISEKIDEENPSSHKYLKSKIILSSVVALVLILLGVLFIPKLIKSSKPAEISIAVLPFHNYSSESDQENISDGLTSEIINHLYKIKSLDKVVPLGSVLTYKGTHKKISQIASELKVNYILEGTYKKIGNEINVTAQLINPKSDKILWQHPYNQSYKDIISLQAEIALQVAGQLKVILTSQEKQNIQKIPTSSKEAYELLQKAFNLWSRGGYQEVDKMLDLSKKAITLDPEYSDAYAWTGVELLLKGISPFMAERDKQLEIQDAESYFNKALEIDQYNGTAHYGLALLTEWIKWDYITAEKEYLNAVELEPNNPEFALVYFDFLIKMNRPENVFIYLKKAKNAKAWDPKQDILKLLVLSGNRKEANDSINDYLKSEKENAFVWAAEIFDWLEEYDSAKFYLESAIKLKNPWILLPKSQATLALAYYNTNQINQAQRIIKQLIGISQEKNPGGSDYYIGWYYSGIGKIDSAFFWLEKAYKNRNSEFSWLKVNPIFKTLKKDPRYEDLYARTGHKAYDDYIAGKKK